MTDSVAGGSAKLLHHTHTDTGGLSRALISNTRHVNSNFFYSLASNTDLRSDLDSLPSRSLGLATAQLTRIRTPNARVHSVQSLHLLLSGNFVS